MRRHPRTVVIENENAAGILKYRVSAVSQMIVVKRYAPNAKKKYPKLSRSRIVMSEDPN